MNDNIPDAARYIAMAADAFAAAERMHNPDAKRLMRKNARSYLRLAATAGERERTITAAPRHPKRAG